MKTWALALSLLALWLPPYKSATQEKPDDNRFTKVVLDNDLNEPMELAIANDGVVYYVERLGQLNSFDPSTNKKKRIAKLNVRVGAEDGLMGIALDPNFLENHWIYLYLSEPIPEQGEYLNVLARFELTDQGLANKKVLLKIPLIHEGVSHSGGSLLFDHKGNLFLSTGDNTNPFESDGYAPIDDRPGRQRFDALKSSGSANDLRGKILRIHPEPDGTYSIPEGNLFKPGTLGTRPEIYVMGCRNPFRIAYDQRRNFLYWGEVGPDAGRDSSQRGPRGHDEFNQARQAGNFGWPLFVGNNKPYYFYDFDLKKSGEIFDPAAPINFSRNNTGIKNLPPAQKALIWYPYTASPEFPELGTGGRNAMGGPVYYYDDYESYPGKFPRCYDGKWFIYEWMRGKVFTVSLDQNGDYQKMERFLPNIEFNHPMDMAFNRKGELYMLEYGTYWRAKNADARLVRIEYNEGNRAPVAKIAADRIFGAQPLSVKFSAEGSFDHDQKAALRYEWFFDQDKVQATGPNANFTFSKKGDFTCRVRVTDEAGKSSENSLLIKVGNDAPKVSINWEGNRSFYFAQSQVTYSVQVKDREEKTNPKRLKVNFYHLPQGEDLAGLMASGELPQKGKTLIDNSDCNACHALNAKSVGPSYLDIAKRYDDKAVAHLASKIIQGGIGVWTQEHQMSAHPQLLVEDAAEMVNYILSLNKSRPQIGQSGQVQVQKSTGNYILMARYTDKNGLVGQDLLRLRPARFSATEADAFQGAATRNAVGQAYVCYNESGAWISFKNIDLKGLKSIKTDVYAPKLVGTLELRSDSPMGALLAAVPINGTGVEVSQAPIEPQNGVRDLYLVYRERAGGINIWNRLDLRWVEFGK
jgi:cytochrome c